MGSKVENIIYRWDNKRMISKKYWFVRKRYGWGWTPATWQGWLVMAIWGVLFYWSVKDADHESWKNISIGVLFTVILILVCFKTGEKPKWQWGDKKV